MREAPNEHNTQQRNLPLVVAIDIGGTQLRAAVVRGTQLLSRASALTGKKSDPQHVLPRLFDLVQQVIVQANISLEQLAGIGIAAPGPLDSRTGIVYDPPNLSDWIAVPLRDLFQEQYHLPVYVENDANAAAHFGTPYAGVSRNVLRGDTISNTNFAVYKDTKLTERTKLQFQMMVFNLFNRQFRGVPDTIVDDTGDPTQGASFGNTYYNYTGGDTSGATQSGIGRRRLQFGLKLVF